MPNSIRGEILKNIARNGFTEDQIMDALKARTGSFQTKYRFDLIRGGATIANLPASGSVRMDRNNEIQRTARFTIYGECGIDWMKDYIKPFILLRMPDKSSTKKIDIGGSWQNIRGRMRNWEQIRNIGATWWDIKIKIKEKTIISEQFAEFPLGVFALSSPTRDFSAEGITYTVEAYDRTVILSEDCLTNRIYFESGTKYTDAVESIIISSGSSGPIITPSDLSFQSGREFEIGESKLKIINTLLSEIVYENLYADENGNFIVSPYKEPTPDNISISYRADDLSVIGVDVSTDLDTYGIPNIFIAIVSNPELSSDLRSIYINDNPASKLSTIYRGRKIVSELYKPDYINSQAELDAYIRRIAFEANQIQERVAFSTVPMPIHGISEILEIYHPDINGIYREESWEIQLEPGGKMTHEASRLVNL